MLAALYALAIGVLTVYGAHWLWLALAHARRECLQPGRPPAPDERPPAPSTWPPVTVQLPLYNETHVAQRLIDACARLEYPRAKLEIQILDDSTDATTDLVRERAAHWQARGLDVAHIHRPHRDGYKAGALKNGLRLARGEFIAIFDADFRPPPDFLKRTIPCFENAAVGMVQARWGHANADTSLLTRLQAFGLDAHFALEQPVRGRLGCFINFNGTAGVWRRRCIASAGGWQSDTLTEDLDLSYRAQLEGWELRYLPRFAVPAELPVEMSALRAQQFRWAKGGLRTACKLLGPLWRSGRPLRVKGAGTLHLSAHLVFPFVLLAALTHAPLIWLDYLGRGPGPLYFAFVGVGLIGFAGFFLAHCFAQRALYPNWRRRLLRFPLFAAGTIGLAVTGTRAAAEALFGRPSAFARTPKYSSNGAAPSAPWWVSRYAAADLPPAVWGEGLMAGYSAAGLVVLIACGAWAALPFQALFALGFTLTAATSLRQVRRVRSVSP